MTTQISNPDQNVFRLFGYNIIYSILNIINLIIDKHEYTTKKIRYHFSQSLKNRITF